MTSEGPKIPEDLEIISLREFHSVDGFAVDRRVYSIECKVSSEKVHKYISELIQKHTIKFAGKLYETYCKNVGGVAFNGDPLPSWEEFSNDPSKKKQVQAWIAVAATAKSML